MKVSECCGSVPWNDTDVCLECMEPADFISHVKYNTQVLSKEKLMDITGIMAIGNGKKCPYCELINEEDTDILKHMMENHRKEFNKELFNE